MSKPSHHDLIGGGPLDVDDTSQLGRSFARLKFEQDALLNDGIDREEVAIGAAHGLAACIAELETPVAFETYRGALPDRLRDLIDEYRLGDVESGAIGEPDRSKEKDGQCQDNRPN